MIRKWIKAGAIAGLFAGAILAQRPFGMLTAGDAPDPATIVQNKVSRLTTLLNLTDAQVTQATAIFTNAQTAVTPLQTTLNAYYTSLQAAVKSNAAGTIDQLSASIGTATGQITAIQNKADAAFYAILTSDQQTTLSNSHGFGGPGPGGPPPGGPGSRMRGGPLP